MKGSHIAETGQDALVPLLSDVEVFHPLQRLRDFIMGAFAGFHFLIFLGYLTGFALFGLRVNWTRVAVDSTLLSRVATVALWPHEYGVWQWELRVLPLTIYPGPKTAQKIVR